MLEHGVSLSRALTLTSAPCSRSAPRAPAASAPLIVLPAARVADRLRLKQPCYPVVFLTCAGSEQYPLKRDARCNSVEAAVMFARAEHLLGIVCNSRPILRDMSLVPFVHDSGLVLFTWGDDNNVRENIERQKSAGVDAVIYDRIGDFKPALPSMRAPLRAPGSGATAPPSSLSSSASTTAAFSTATSTTSASSNTNGSLASSSSSSPSSSSASRDSSDSEARADEQLRADLIAIRSRSGNAAAGVAAAAAAAGAAAVDDNDSVFIEDGGRDTDAASGPITMPADEAGDRAGAATTAPDPALAAGTKRTSPLQLASVPSAPTTMTSDVEAAAATAVTAHQRSSM